MRTSEDLYTEAAKIHENLSTRQFTANEISLVATALQNITLSLVTIDLIETYPKFAAQQKAKGNDNDGRHQPISGIPRLSKKV